MRVRQKIKGWVSRRGREGRWQKGDDTVEGAQRPARYHDVFVPRTRVLVCSIVGAAAAAR